MARNGNAKTRRFALNMLKAGVAIFGAALLFACGDDSSSGADDSQTATGVDSTVESVDDLINCTSKHEGETAYIKEEKATYVCTDADWVVAGETGDGDDDDGDDADKKSSSSKAKSSSSVESSSGVIPGSDPESSSSVESSRSRGFFDMTKDEFLNPKVSYGEMTDTRDNQVYKTVEICNNETSTCQTWMAENLNYSVNPNVRSWCGGGSGATEGDCSVYGRLYTWAAAVGKSEDECGSGKTCKLLSGDIRGVCPEGWHLPSDVEWRNLIEAAGGIFYAGQKLKADSDLWNKGTSNDDSFGFAVLPAGYRSGNGSFYGEGSYAYFWSSTEYYSYGAYERYFDFRSDAVYNDWYDKSNRFFSVRCLRDSN